MRRFLAAMALVVAAVISLSSPASAHAVLESTDPVSGAILDEPPAQLSLAFSETVLTTADSVRLYDGRGQRVNLGAPSRREGGAVVVVDVPAVDDGAYIVTWRVVSADSHPIRGAFTFRVGDAPAADTGALLRELLNAQGGSAAVGAAYGVMRFLAFSALILFVGGGAFVMTLWRRDDPRSRRLLTLAWVGSVATTAGALALQAVYAAGRPLGDVARWSVIEEVFEGRFGRAWAVRLVLLTAAGPLLAGTARAQGRRRRAGLGALVVVAGVVLATPGIAGHPGADSPAALTVAVDAVHLAAASVWLGGLAVLALIVLRRATPDDAVVTARRFSPVAFTAVVTVAVTGTLQAWRQSRSVDAVTDTTYGRVLLVKVAFVAAMVLMAALSRAWLRHHATQATTGPSLRRLRVRVGAEAALSVAVVAMTALLVNAIPARTALAQPFSTSVQVDDIVVDVTVDPAKTGSVDIHTYTLAATGAVTDVEEVVVQLSLPGRDIGPLVVPVQRAGPGHFAAYGFDIPLAGRWTMDITVRTSDIRQQTATTTLRIR